MENQQTMRLKDWIITLILTFIPIVNIIMLILWTSNKENPRSNFSKAYMIVTGTIISISFVLVFIAYLFTAYIGEIGSQSGEEYQPSYEHYEYTNRADDIEITEIEFVENLVDTSITGKVLNKSGDHTFENIAISGNVYDDSGSIIDSFIIYLNQNIPPGESYKFYNVGFTRDAHSIKVDKVSHYSE